MDKHGTQIEGATEALDLKTKSNDKLGKAMAALISLFFAAMGLKALITGHHYAGGSRSNPNPVDFTGSAATWMGWIMLALAVMPLGLFAKSKKQALFFAVGSFALIMCAVFGPLVLGSK